MGEVRVEVNVVVHKVFSSKTCLHHSRYHNIFVDERLDRVFLRQIVPQRLLADLEDNRVIIALLDVKEVSDRVQNVHVAGDVIIV